MVLIIALGVQDNPSPVQRYVICGGVHRYNCVLTPCAVVCRISGVLMVGAVVSRGCARKRVGVSGSSPSVVQVLIAVDIGMMGTPPEKSSASEQSKGECRAPGAGIQTTRIYPDVLGTDLQGSSGRASASRRLQRCTRRRVRTRAPRAGCG